jgi:hypothetical protein
LQRGLREAKANETKKAEPSNDDREEASEFDEQILLQSPRDSIERMLLESPTVSMNQILLESLIGMLKKHNWPVCLCPTQCSCGAPTVPEWVENFAKVDPYRRCLDIQELDLNSPFFLDGMKLAFAHLSRNHHNEPFSLLLEYLSSPEEPLILQDKILVQKELVLENIAKCRNEKLHAKASGFYCGYTVFEQQARWVCYRYQSMFGKCFSFSVDSMMTLLDDLLRPLDGLRVWLSDSSRCDRMPQMKIVLVAAAFWTSQWVLYLIYEVKMNVFFGFNRIDDEYDRGLLLWQQGWMATHPDIVKALLSVFRFD